MILDVPLIRQPENSLECGIAGLAMILKYHGIAASIEDLRKEIIVDNNVGTYAPQLGTYLLKNGFDVEIITMHPALFTNKTRLSSDKDFVDYFKKLFETSKSEQTKKVLSYFIEFLENGGKVTPKIPNIRDIQEEINYSRPLAALMTTNFIYHDEPVFNFHFNVIIGIDENYVYVNDPLWDSRGGKNKYTISEFLYGLYASAYGDLDNACLIKIKKK